MGVFHRIVVPVDFNASSRAALDLAVRLAREDAADLTIVHAFEIPGYPYISEATTRRELLASAELAARAAIDQTVASVRQLVPGARADLRCGTPWQEILGAIADARADLVVMGTHGRRGVAHVLLGSVAEKIVRLSPIPVLTVRAPVEA